MSEDTRSAFHKDLAAVSRSLGEMAALVTEGIGKVTAALLSSDVSSADQIVAADDDLDLIALETEEQIVLIMATQAPVAADLREAVTDLKMVGEIERSGDLVTNIAKAIPRIHGTELDPQLRGLISQMSEQCVWLFGHAMDSYNDRDAGLAKILHELDDRLDDLHDEYIQGIFDSRSQHVLNTQQALQLAVIGRFYERIGDHAVNIAERVEYLVTGSLPEHAGAARAKARRDGAGSGD